MAQHEVTTGEVEMALLLSRWRDRILKKAATKIENHLLNTPVEDHTAEERGFERGLGVAVNELCLLMDDPSYFGREKRSNAQAKRAAESGSGLGAELGGKDEA